MTMKLDGYVVYPTMSLSSFAKRDDNDIWCQNYVCVVIFEQPLTPIRHFEFLNFTQNVIKASQLRQNQKEKINQNDVKYKTTQLKLLSAIISYDVYV